jgi:hypothetical protein
MVLGTSAAMPAFELLAKHDELPADVADRVAIVLAEVCDRFEVRCQTSR